MTFITTDMDNYKNINQDTLKEVVIIIKDINNKKVLFNFPFYRFSDYDDKYNIFLNKIKGIKVIENNMEYIQTNESDYNIYMEFYLTFY